jgi:hypothetical protein
MQDRIDCCCGSGLSEAAADDNDEEDIGSD